MIGLELMMRYLESHFIPLCKAIQVANVTEPLDALLRSIKQDLSARA